MKTQNAPSQFERIQRAMEENPGASPRAISHLFPNIGIHQLSKYMYTIRKANPQLAAPYQAKNKPDALTLLLQKHKISHTELETILTSGQLKPARDTYNFDLGKTGTFKFMVISDTHIGSSKFDMPTWEMVVKIANRDRPAFIIHPGDHLEGMSGRPGHVYELAQIGFEAQMDEAVRLYSMLPQDIPMYGIDGNHDQWYKAKADIGIVVGRTLQNRCPNYHHLGEWEGILTVSDIRIMLFHANDGTAYANSYKGQKLIESLLEMEKPHLLFEGHYHKALFQSSRGIHQWESGTVCRQTGFMRGKKIPAHVGFWMIEVEHEAGNVLGVTSKWYSLPCFR